MAFSRTHPLRQYLNDVAESVPDFAARVGVSRQTLYRIISGQQTPRPALARRIVEATGGAVTLDDLFGVEGGKIIDIGEGRDEPELDRHRLRLALAIVVNHLLAPEAPEPPTSAIEIAAEAVGGTYAALAPVTTRQGPARLKQALRPVLEEILREFSDPPPPGSAIDRAADLATELYFQSWRRDAPPPASDPD